MCFRCVFVLFYCLTTYLPPTDQTRRSIDNYRRHIPEVINSELTRQVVQIISDAAINRRRYDGEQNMYMSELSAPQPASYETLREDPIPPSHTLELNEEYYSDDEEKNDREELENYREEPDQPQYAVPPYLRVEESTPINVFDATRPVTQETGTAPEAQRELRAVPEIDIDNIAERVKQKLEKYFITTPQGDFVTKNFLRGNSHKSSQRQIQLKKIQQLPTFGNKDDTIYYDVTEPTANNNNENSKEDYEYSLGKESMIHNDFKTVPSATTTQEQYKQEQENENTEVKYATYKNKNKPVANNNQRQHKMLKKDPNSDHNGNRQQKRGKNKKIYVNSDYGTGQSQANNNRQDAQATNKNEPDEYENNNNEGQQTSVNENAQETLIKDKDVTYAVLNNDDQQAFNNENVENTYLNNANEQKSNINNNDKRDTIGNNNLKQMTTSHERQNKRKNKNRQSNSNWTHQAQGYRQLNLPQNDRYDPQNLETTISQYQALAEQTPVPPRKIKNRLKMRPHLNPDIKRPPAQMVKELPIENGENEELLMEESHLSGKKGDDFYNDYKIPEKDSAIFDSHEPSSGIGYKAMPQRKTKPTTSDKVVTKNLNFDSEEVAKNPKVLNFKRTGLPKKSTFSIFRPDFPDKMPIIAVNYNFSEPIPERDRVVDNTTFDIPPAMVNGKISLV